MISLLILLISKAQTGASTPVHPTVFASDEASF